MTDLQTPEDSSSTSLRPYSDVEYVFEAERSTLPSARQYLRDAWERRHFVSAMAKADLRGARSRTVLGEVWAVMDPLIQAGIYWFLILTIRSGSTDNPTERLTILISGVFLFTFIFTVVGGGGKSIVKNRGLMLNSTFPRVLLPATEVYKGLLDLGPALVIYAIIHLLLGAPVGPGIFVMPLLLALQVLISTGLGLIFATITVFVKDMSNLLQYILRLLFFATPILYPVSMLPETAQTILVINPFFALFASYQAVVTGGVPSIGYVLQSVAWAIVLCVAGYRIFSSRERTFALRL